MNVDDFCIKEFISDYLNYSDDDIIRDYGYGFEDHLLTCGYGNGTGGNNPKYQVSKKLPNPNTGPNIHHTWNYL